MSANRPLVPSRGRRGELITGRLEGHGKANYQFEPDGSPSYYVKLVTGRGLETVWGTDLERAITRSKTQPKIGTLVGVRRVGSQPVTVPAREGERTSDGQRTFRRSIWEVESTTYFAQAVQQAKREVKARLEDRRTMIERPELRSAYISLHVAERFAEEHIGDPRDRVLFVRRVKAVMTASVGEIAHESRSLDRRSLQSNQSKVREDPTR